MLLHETRQIGSTFVSQDARHLRLSGRVLGFLHCLLGFFLRLFGIASVRDGLDHDAAELPEAILSGTGCRSLGRVDELERQAIRDGCVGRVGRVGDEGVGSTGCSPQRLRRGGSRGRAGLAMFDGPVDGVDLRYGWVRATGRGDGLPLATLG